ncbi:hypothetical protein GEMRC1_004415 [Eukaryota sp. GEM-RC1]
MRANGEIFFTATTGVASTVFGEQTIHSLFGYKFMKEEESIHDVIKCMPSNVRILLKKITPKNSMLIIDEISMLSSKLFQRASDILSELMYTPKCHSPKKPFGGIQIICFGDFLQLAPVVKSLDGKGNRKVVISDFAFSSSAWNSSNFKYCELTGTIRQQSDSQFFNFLNQSRLGLFNNFMKSILRTHFETAESVENPTVLYGRNTDVAEENFNQFKILAKNSDSIEFVAVDQFNESELKSQIRKRSFRFPVNESNLEKYYDIETSVLTSRLDDFAEKKLDCVVGGQVMYTQNKPELGLVNGSKGVIVNFSDSYIDVRINAEAEPKRISQSRFAIEHLNEIGRPVQVAKRIQFPLRPCWAITVHRSQGLTIDGIEVAIQFWEYAQLYVTLSRVRSWRSLKFFSIGRSYPVPNLELYQWYYSTFHPVKPSTIDLYVLGNQHYLQRDFNHLNSLFANFCAESSVSIMDDIVVPEIVHCVDEVVDEVIVDNVNQIIDLEKIV